MKKSLILIFAILLLSPAVFAHRLNEYLQATTISLSRGKVLMELRLTPGVAVASEVLKGIDLNSDDHISDAEQHAYLATLRHDFSLTLDGRVTAPKMVSFSFPTAEAMRKGTGDILIEYEAKLEKEGPSHQLKMENNHYSSNAVYLVNCLLPSDTNISVVSQSRNANQSVYQLNFTTCKAQFAKSTDQQSLTKADHQAILKTYFVHGTRHILTSYDHLLFLCALGLGAAGLWDLIKIVTAFTIAHSITLTLAVFGYAKLPEFIVEPLIAASIVFVALQNITRPELATGYYRLVVAFFFGLFHGLGFAGGLMELMHAMPVGMFVYAIFGFSLGIETGNWLVLIPLYGTLQSLKRISDYGKTAQQLVFVQWFASAGVAIAGLYYLCVDLYVFI